MKTDSQVELTCERCGAFGAVEIGDHRLCLDCYECSGSCCPEFGGDDLWEFEEEAPKPAPVPTSKTL